MAIRFFDMFAGIGGFRSGLEAVHVVNFALVLGVGTVSSLMWYLLDSFFVRIKRRY